MGQVIQGKTEIANKHKKRCSTSPAMQIKTTKYFGYQTGKSEKVWQYGVWVRTGRIVCPAGGDIN